MVRNYYFTQSLKLVKLTALLGLLSAVPAAGQGTVMPIPLAQWFDNNGAVLNGGGLCVFEAGTSTLATTYTTAALSVANANPIPLNSAGRPTSGGVFLTPGASYKFVLKSATVTTCVPDTGTTIWSVDNVNAVPGSASSTDITGVAGESIAAGDAVFLSNGAGSLTAGQWYRTDADFTYRSTYAAMVGVAPSAVNSGASGSFRVSGAVTTTGLTTGSAYFAGATVGAIVTTPPTNAIRIGQAQSSTVLIVGQPIAPSAPRGPPCGRLTLTTGVPVTTTDVTAAATLYYTPYLGCNTVSTFDGTQWNETAFTQLSIAAPAAANQMYDVFLYDNAGVLALELTAWTNDTTRATALTTQNGVYVKTGALTRLYLGSVRTVTASQFNDSIALRHVFNYYRRVPRELRVNGSGTWTYTTNTFRQAGGVATYQLDLVVGVAEQAIEVKYSAGGANSTGAIDFYIGIGYDSTSAVATGSTGVIFQGASNIANWGASVLTNYPAAGRHTYVPLEKSTATGTTTWYGATGAILASIQALFPM